MELIANPGGWEGKRVEVTGFMHLEFEGNAIYVSRTDYEDRLYKNGLWLGFDTRTAAVEAPVRNDRFVRLEATFTAQSQGHFDLWSGCLYDIDGPYDR